MMTNPDDRRGYASVKAHWKCVSRKACPDLSGGPKGYVVAVELLGLGVIVGGTQDPAYYLLTLWKKYKFKGLFLGNAWVSEQTFDWDGFAREIIHSFAGNRRRFAGLVKRDLESVWVGAIAHLIRWDVVRAPWRAS